MLTDLAPKDARALADRMTRFRLAAQTLLGPQQLSGRSPQILAFRRARDFRREFSLPNIGGFTLSSLDRYKLAFGPDGRRGYASRALTAFHEYTHYLLRHHRQMNYPAWYEEGYANFLSTVYMAEDGLVVGHVPVFKRREMFRSKPTLAELLDERFMFDWKRRDLEAIYLKSWLLVHMLHLGHLSGLPASLPASLPPFHTRVPEMLAMIDAGTPAAVAIETALGVTLDDLGRLLNAYGRRSSLPTQTLVANVDHEIPMDVEPMTRAEVRRTLAGAAVATGNDSYAAQLFQQVLQENPDDIDALVGLSATAGDLTSSLETARRALALDADHPDANIRMAELHATKCGQSTRDQCYAILLDSAKLYRRALRSDPDGVDAAFGLGVTYLHAGQPGNALGYLRVAYRRAPWAPRVNHFLGEAYRLIGDAQRARVHLSKAMHWHREELWRERAALALSMLESPADE